MGLYDWIVSRLRTPRIPRDIFVEDSDPIFDTSMSSENDLDPKTHTENTFKMASTENKEISNELFGIEMIEDFLSKDFEPDGYNDALIDPNNTYAEAEKQRLISLLELKVGIAIRYHDDKIKDFQSAVDRLATNNINDEANDKTNEKHKHEEMKKKLENILSDAKTKQGIGYMIILSYERGFKRGIASWLNSKLSN